MFKKLNKKGFTLAELLIVVAIIGVLVAISIPIFTSQLEKAREATDLANQRAAKAAAVAAYLDADATGNETYYYDAKNGVAVAADKKGGIAKYGKGTESVGSKTNAVDGYVPENNYKDKICKVDIVGNEDATNPNTVTIAWE